MAMTSVPRTLQRLAFLALALGLAACGGGGPAAKALGQEAVVEHANVSPGTGPTTTLAVTALAVRTGTIADLEAGGLSVDAKDRARTPTYVDVRYENRGSQTIDRRLRVSMEDGSGKLISPVTIFNFGGVVYEPCPDRTDGALAPGEKFETCVLFLVDPAHKAARVSFLPHVPGKDTDWVYWNVP